MKRILHGLGMAFGMFCAIPCPYHGWDESARPLTTVFLPVVGAVTGGLWYVLSLLLGWLRIPAAAGAAVMTVFPWLITGFIHLDGYMDCSDAILSRRELAEKQRILKDSRVGAFAVISLGCLLLLTFSFFLSLNGKSCLPLLFVPVGTRAVSGVAVSILRPMGHSQYSGAYREGVRSGHVAILVLEAAAALGICALVCGVVSAAVPAAAMAVSVVTTALCVRSLGGMSGDVSGCAITLGEACAAAALMLL